MYSVKLSNNANPSINHTNIPMKNIPPIDKDLKKLPSKNALDEESFYSSPNRRKHRRLKAIFIIQFIMVVLIFIFVVAVTVGTIYIALKVNAIIIKADNGNLKTFFCFF